MICRQLTHLIAMEGKPKTCRIQETAIQDHISQCAAATHHMSDGGVGFAGEKLGG